MCVTDVCGVQEAHGPAVCLDLFPIEATPIAVMPAPGVVKGNFEEVRILIEVVFPYAGTVSCNGWKVFTPAIDLCPLSGTCVGD